MLSKIVHCLLCLVGTIMLSVTLKQQYGNCAKYYCVYICFADIYVF